MEAWVKEVLGERDELNTPSNDVLAGNYAATIQPRWLQAALLKLVACVHCDNSQRH